MKQHSVCKNRKHSFLPQCSGAWEPWLAHWSQWWSRPESLPSSGYQRGRGMWQLKKKQPGGYVRWLILEISGCAWWQLPQSPGVVVATNYGSCARLGGSFCRIQGLQQERGPQQSNNQSISLKAKKYCVDAKYMCIQFIVTFINF